MTFVLFHLIHSEFVIAVLVEIISTEGQGTLIYAHLFFDDLKIRHQVFALLCYLMLFYNRTKMELNFA